MNQIGGSSNYRYQTPNVDYDLIGYIEPKRIPGLYKNGQLKGVKCDKTETADFISKLENPIFSVAAWDLIGTGEGKVSLPFAACVKLDPDFGTYEAQTTGDCVSHSTRNAGYLDYCVDVLNGETQYKGRFATENIYGWRGHRGQGASCSTLAKYVHSKQGIGGFLTRKPYKSGRNLVDLSKYNSRLGHNWGSRGTPDWLNTLAHEHPAKTVSYISTIEEARDAIANGYGISCCSSYGFSSVRNDDGVSRSKGRWYHAMAWIGCDDSSWTHNKYGGPLFLVQNSWGIWNSGGKRHNQPDGSFWITSRDAQGILNAQGSYVISSIVGFKKRKIDFMLI